MTVKFRPAYRRGGEILAGLAIAATLFICLALTRGAGGCLNPWFGFAQNVYGVGLYNDNDSTGKAELLKANSLSVDRFQNDDGSYKTGGMLAHAIYIYIVGPFVGAILAGICYLLQVFSDNQSKHGSADEMHEINKVGVHGPRPSEH